MNKKDKIQNAMLKTANVMPPNNTQFKLHLNHHFKEPKNVKRIKPLQKNNDELKQLKHILNNSNN